MNTIAIAMKAKEMFEKAKASVSATPMGYVLLGSVVALIATVVIDVVASNDVVENVEAENVG